MKTKVMEATSILDVDLQALKKDGIDCLLLDIEGTLAEYAGADVSDDITRHIKDSGIKKIGIITNINRAHAQRVRQVAEQVGASSHWFPKSFSQRKPSTYMFRRCLDELDAKAENTVMIGDTVMDAYGAKRTSLAQVYWLEKLGRADHWLVRRYRRIEPLLKKALS